MAEVVWNVQPYAKVSELINRYTSVIISTTAGQAEKRAAEAETWMQDNAPWRDRTDKERHRARSQTRGVPDRHAREALSVQEVLSANAKRHFTAMPLQAARDDAKALKAENARRTQINKDEDRTPSRQLKLWEKLPQSRSRKATIQREIRVEKGPIVELRFSHGTDIWYGIWLEIAFGGRYNIIRRAVDHWAPIFLNDIKRIANLVQFNIAVGEEVRTERDVFAARVEQEDISFLEQGRDRLYEPWSRERQVTHRARHARYERSKREASEFAESGVATKVSKEVREAAERAAGFEQRRKERERAERAAERRKDYRNRR